MVCVMLEVQALWLRSSVVISTQLYSIQGCEFVCKKSLWFADEIPIISYNHEFTGDISLLFFPTCFLLALCILRPSFLVCICMYMYMF